MAESIYSTVLFIHPDIKKLFKFYNELIKFIIKINLSIEWITPNGVIINQKYNKLKEINFSYFDTTTYRRRKVVLKHSMDSMDTIKNKNAIIPNIIHS